MAYASVNTKFYHGYPTPGPQNPTVDQVMARIFFASEETWKQARETMKFDYIVIGSGFCSYAFVDRIVKNAHKENLSEENFPKILIIERGSFFLPAHFQNLPYSFKLVAPQQNFMNETFPWTLAPGPATSDPSRGFKPDANNPQIPGGASWMHGMVPFFGGRSVYWSGWTPRPDRALDELIDWPEELLSMMTDEFFEGGERLLNSTTADKIGKCSDLPKKFHVYGDMQIHVQEKLAAAIGPQSDGHPSKIPVATRAFGAPMAVANCGGDPLVTFQKYSVVGPYVGLLQNEPNNVTCALDCSVSRIIHHNNVPTALETSRGIVPLDRDTKIILAVGCMPAATLLLNSFPTSNPDTGVKGLENVGNKFAAHVTTAIVAKVPIEAFQDMKERMNEFEIGAVYLAGVVETSSGRKLTFHADMSMFRVANPEVNYEKHSAQAFRYMPDVVATVTDKALLTSGGDVVFVLALLGEMDVYNKDNTFKMLDPNAADKTANCILDYSISEADNELWAAMDRCGIDTVEKVLGHYETQGIPHRPIQYWVDPNPTGNAGTHGYWVNASELKDEQKIFHATGLVHESSVVSCGRKEEGHACDFNFRPYGTENVYVTGSGLWPTGCSWNPTMTMCAFAQKLADDLFREKHDGKHLSHHQSHVNAEHSERDQRYRGSI